MRFGKRIIATTVAAVIALLPVYAQEMEDYLEHTSDLERQGKYQEALERHIWFHDHALEHEPALYGVRLSFALGSWMGLAAVYPEALTAMKDIRDKKTLQIENREGTFALFHDVVALNQTLGEIDKTVVLFRQLDKDQTEFAQECWPVAKDSVIDAKEFKIARKYIGNFRSEFENAKKTYKTNMARYESRDVEKEILEFFVDHFVKETLQLIDVAIATDDMQAALEIQQDALTVMEDNRLREAIANKDPNPAL